MEKSFNDLINKQEEEKNPNKITIKEFCEICNLEVLNDLSPDTIIEFSSISVNRPGLFFAGFENYFAESRIQVLGNAETYYLKELPIKQREKVLHSFFSTKIPCVIFARGITPDKHFLEISQKYSLPIFSSREITSELINNISKFLNYFLSETEILNAELIEVSGIGVLLFGKSGMGKSETALDLVTRGHRLVADDVVIVRHIKDELIGTAPESIRFLMEIRGMGIIDIRRLFGVGSVTDETSIDLAIELTKWTKDSPIERLGDIEQSENILGVNIPKITIPVVAGRNMAIIVEVAARNYRLKKLGYNSIEELLKRQDFES